MPKYRDNAGFKGYEDNTDNESKVSPKILFIIGAAAFIVVFIGVLLIVAFSGSDGDTVQTETTQAITQESLDYNDVFGHDENYDESSSDSSDSDSMMFSVPPTVSDVNSSSSDSSSSKEDSKKESSKSKNEGKKSEEKKNSSSSSSSQSHNTESNNSNSNGGNYSNNNNYNNNNYSSKQYSYNPPKEESKSKTVTVTSVSISQSSLSLTVGSKSTLSASAQPSNAADREITWSSTNNSIATVKNGTVIAKSAGSCTIVAGTPNGTKAYCNVSVKEKPVVSVVDPYKLNFTEKELYKGQKTTIQLNGAGKCTWELSNPYVAKIVDQSKNYIVIQANKTGMTNVVATYKGKSYKCKVTVK